MTYHFQTQSCNLQEGIKNVKSYHEVETLT